MVSFGGYNYMKAPSQVDPRLPVYKPKMVTLQGGKSSEEDQREMQKNLAGGLLMGYQYRPLKRPELYGTNPSAAISGQAPLPSYWEGGQGPRPLPPSAQVPEPPSAYHPMPHQMAQNAAMPDGWAPGMPNPNISDQPSGGLLPYGGGALTPSGVYGGGQIAPIDPEGVFIPDDGTAPPDVPEEEPEGQFTMREVMEFERAAMGGNYGNNEPPPSVFSMLEPAGNGTFNFKPGVGQGGQEHFTMGQGATSFEDFIDQNTGKPVTRQKRNALIQNSLRSVDNSPS